MKKPAHQDLYTASSHSMTVLGHQLDRERKLRVNPPLTVKRASYTSRRLISSVPAPRTTTTYATSTASAPGGDSTPVPDRSES